MNPEPPILVGSTRDITLQRFQGPHASTAIGHRRNFHVSAGTSVNQFPGVALVIYGRGASACGAGACGAVILASKRDAIAFLFFSGDGGRCVSCQCGCDGASNGESFYGIGHLHFPFGVELGQAFLPRHVSTLRFPRCNAPITRVCATGMLSAVTMSGWHKFSARNGGFAWAQHHAIGSVAGRDILKNLGRTALISAFCSVVGMAVPLCPGSGFQPMFLGLLAGRRGGIECESGNGLRGATNFLWPSHRSEIWSAPTLLLRGTAVPRASPKKARGVEVIAVNRHSQGPRQMRFGYKNGAQLAIVTKIKGRDMAQVDPQNAVCAPFCNNFIAYERRLDGEITRPSRDFGVLSTAIGVIGGDRASPVVPSLLNQMPLRRRCLPAPALKPNSRACLRRLFTSLNQLEGRHKNANGARIRAPDGCSG
ncbi:hypothetical protein shim_16480 [Shimia sp. SK013]|nr:hypothetical protein shim_16480 [Shimia sp. SK013]